MRLENLKVGKGIEIFVTRAGYRYRLVSTIEGTAVGKAFVTLIASGEKVFRFMDTDTVDIVYRDETHMLQWDKVKGSVELLDGTKVHCLTSKKDGFNFNRRNAFRVNIDETSILYSFKKKEIEGNPEEDNKEVEQDDYGNEIGSVNIEEYEGYLKDMSETGVGIYSSHIYNIGEIIGFPLFTSYGPMYFKAEIVRHMERRNEKYMEFYGCTFVRADKNLGKYLFTLQRERLQKQRQGE